MNRKTAARAIKTARTAAGFSVEELARRSSTTADIINALESETIDLDEHTRNAIEDALDIPSVHRGIILDALGADPASASAPRRAQRDLLCAALAAKHRVPTRNA